MSTKLTEKEVEAVEAFEANPIAPVEGTYSEAVQELIDLAILEANSEKTGFRAVEEQKAKRKELLAKRSKMTKTIKGQKEDTETVIDSLNQVLGLLSAQAFIANGNKEVPASAISVGCGIPKGDPIPSGIRTPWSNGLKSARQVIETGEFMVGDKKVTTENLIKGELPDGVLVYSIITQMQKNKIALKEANDLKETRAKEELATDCLAGDIFILHHTPFDIVVDGETINCATGQDIASQYARGNVVDRKTQSILIAALDYGHDLLAKQKEQDERLGAISGNIQVLNVDVIVNALAECIASDAQEAQEAVATFMATDFAGLTMAQPAKMTG